MDEVPSKRICTISFKGKFEFYQVRKIMTNLGKTIFTISACAIDYMAVAVSGKVERS